MPTFRHSMTFGQLSVLRALQRLPEEHWSGTYLVTVVETPHPVPLDEVTSAIRTLAGRHDTLRSHFAEDGTAEVQDRIDDVAVDVVAQPDCEEAQAGAIGEQHAARRFDWETELAWRVTVIHDRGLVSHIVLVTDHIVADGDGLHRLVSELKVLLGGAGAAGTRWLAERPPQPAELAATQRSDAWRHKRESADRYWDRLLSESDPRVFPVPASAGAGRIQLTMYSSLTRSRLSRAAELTGVTAQSLLLALTTVGVSVVRDAEKVVLSIQSGNRFDRKWRDIVSSMNQAVPMPIAAAPGHTYFREFAERTQAANLRAYRNGAYDIDAVSEKVRIARGTELIFDNYFNFLVHDLARGDSAGQTPTRWVTSRPRRQFGPTFDLKVRSGPEMPVLVRADPELVDESALRDLLGWLDGEIARLAEGEKLRMSAVYGRLERLLGRQDETRVDRPH